MADMLGGIEDHGMENNRAREVYERNKERSLTTKTPAFSVREWLLALFTFVGLSLTAISTYFVTIRTIDEVRIVVNRAPVISWQRNNVRIASKLDLTFVNSGNRSAAITSITLIFYQDSKTCEAGENASIKFNIEAFVIKPGEVFVKSLSYSKESTSLDDFPKVKVNENLEGAMVEVGGDKPIQDPMLRAENDHDFAVCLTATYVTPNAHRSSEVLLRTANTGESLIRQFFGKQGLDTSAPWIIVRETGSIFGTTDTTPRMTKSIFDTFFSLPEPAPPPIVYP
jgi:hypothetical protein